ncbi:MAG: Dabb family protein [Acidobacteriota bacterium]
MYLHLVLFKPRPDLGPARRDELVTALEHALTDIPLIRRARVGRRIVMGRVYDAANTIDFPYVAAMEFDTETDLRAYLDHPAHARIGRLFYETAEASLAYDFEVADATTARQLLSTSIQQPATDGS